MIGWMAKLFAGPEAATKVVSGIADAVDDNVWSKEERAGFIGKLYESTTGSSIARRIIAIIVTLMFSLGCLLSMLGIVLGASWVGDMTNFMSDSLKDPFMAVVGFYFLVRALGALRK